MVDFGKLISDSPGAMPTEPGELFRSLLATSRLPYLRDVQQDVLRAWYEKRSRDTIVKMSTGAGKTIVGLLMLQSSLNEGLGPALYVCPTRQLVEQVERDARDLGVGVVSLVGAGQLPVEFDNCEKILVTTFSKLFNGRSVFKLTPGNAVDVGSLVIDDAHSCLKIAREQVTVAFPAGSQVYRDLFSMFQNSLSEQSLSKTAEIADGYPYTFQAVPYWIWQASCTEVAKILVREQSGEELKFAWNLFKGSLETCNCVFSGSKVELCPNLTPIEAIPSFADARRRFFLSATLADDSILPKEFSVDPIAVQNTLRTAGNSDIGERMILVPDLIEPGLGESLPDKLKALALTSNVVVLVPSRKAAVRWENAGARSVYGASVSAAIQKLRTSVGNFLVLINRYDGIDLPDDACRILVVDGLPIGESLFEQYQASARRDSMLAMGETAQTIEQGFGRGVRSGKDRCVVLLTGRGLVRFVSVKRNQELFSPATRQQIGIGQQISKLAKQESASGWESLVKLMEQCVSGDENWRRFHASQMATVQPPTADKLRLEVGSAQRQALNCYIGGDPAQAVETMRKLVNLTKESDRPADAGWFLQIGAGYEHATNPSSAQSMQKRAHEFNSNLLRPRTGVRYQRMEQRNGFQAERVKQWIDGHISANAIVSSLGDILDRLVFGGDSERFEEAWAELGKILGFNSQRPEREFGKGPDGLWSLPNRRFLIAEAKNEVKESRGKVYQSETEQLSNSVNWFVEEYGDDIEFQSILIHPSSTLHSRAFPPAGSLALEQSGMARLHHAIRNIGAAIASRSLDAWTVDEVTRLLHDHSLTDGSFAQGFCSDFKRS